MYIISWPYLTHGKKYKSAHGSYDPKSAYLLFLDRREKAQPYLECALFLQAAVGALFLFFIPFWVPEMFPAYSEGWIGEKRGSLCVDNFPSKFGWQGRIQFFGVVGPKSPCFVSFLLLASCGPEPTLSSFSCSPSHRSRGNPLFRPFSSVTSWRTLSALKSLTWLGWAHWIISVS